MTKLQAALITIGSAILFQVGQALANLSENEINDWESWAVGVGIGVANAIGIAIIALKTAGGVTLESGESS